jgi:glycosyltransferase involved in cell wall biosynthesis
MRGRFSGVVRYTHELVLALASMLPDLTLFVTRADSMLDGVSIHQIRAPFSTPNEYARAFWEQVIVPVEVARLAPDVYHSPNYILPLAIRCPSVVTVHDLAYMESSLHRIRSHLYLSVLTALAIRKATRIICPSTFTRAALVRHYPELDDRIRVVSEGVDERFCPQPRKSVDSFRERLGLHQPYVLFVGTIEPRKNIARLIRAFDAAVARNGFEHELVIAGDSGWRNSDVQLEISRARARVRLLGYVADKDLALLYSGADLFAFPALYEGFGLPPLEAMACGVPVLTSNQGALPEVVGNAAVMVDPVDEDALATALSDLLGDPALRARLRRLGLEQAKKYRWEVAAEHTLAVYAEAAR